jgi:hypothetical protein
MVAVLSYQSLDFPPEFQAILHIRFWLRAMEVKITITCWKESKKTIEMTGCNGRPMNVWIHTLPLSIHSNFWLASFIISKFKKWIRLDLRSILSVDSVVIWGLKDQECRVGIGRFSAQKWTEK